MLNNFEHTSNSPKIFEHVRHQYSGQALYHGKDNRWIKNLITANSAAGLGPGPKAILGTDVTGRERQRLVPVLLDRNPEFSS